LKITITNILIYLTGILLISSSCIKQEILSLPAVSTDSITEINYFSAKATGAIESLGAEGKVSQYGHCWSYITSNPTIEFPNTNHGTTNETENYTSLLEGLDSMRTYYVRAYAINGAGVAYGDILQFNTNPLPRVTTGSLLWDNGISAIVSGSIDHLGTDGEVVQYGHCWAQADNNPGLESGNYTEFGGSQTSLEYESEMTGLTRGETYFVRAYAINSKGVAYGEVLKITTDLMQMMLQTNFLFDYSYTTVGIHAEAFAEPGVNILEKGIIWSKDQSATLETAEGFTTEGGDSGTFTSFAINLKPGNTYFFRVYASNSIYTAYGNALLFKTWQACPEQAVVYDSEGNAYNTIQIDDQCWMKENLRTGVMLLDENPADNSIIEKWCYNNDTALCNKYGGLYNWQEILDYKANFEQGEKEQGICPDGWHIPDDSDWNKLVENLGGSVIAGGKLKEEGIGHWNEPNANGTNESGFTALPAGMYTSVSTFNYLGQNAYLWSTAEMGNLEAWTRTLYYSNQNVGRYSTLKTNGLSLRCIKDEED
jgi:uncharacterized protein (TIGR02145 family)